MSQSRTLCIGMEVHTDAIAVAYVARDHGAAGTSLGTIGTRPCAIEQRTRTRQSKAQPLLFVSEAGPYGYWLSRSLRQKGYDCWVVAPSLMPKKAGERVQTDRRDAGQLACLMRSGDLPSVSVPKVEDAAMRDLPRAREEALGDLKTARCRLTACLLRPDRRYTGRATWGPAPLRWLSAVVCPTPAQQMVCQEYVRAVTEHTERLQRLDQALQEQGKAWRVHPVVEALQALRGVQCTVAVPPVAALGDLPRFATPRALMQCLGLLPSESSPGARRRQGAMPTAGNTHARRALVAGAWAYRYPAKVSRHLHLRREKHPHIIPDSSWQAHVRLCTRSRRLLARGT